MRRCFLALGALFALITPVLAQSSQPATITQFQQLILPPTGDPLTLAPINAPGGITTTTIGPTQNCGLDPATLPPPATPPVVNPRLYIVDDPFTPGKKCRLAFPQVLPIGSYQWAGVFIAASCNPTGTQVVSPCLGPRTVGAPNFSIADRILAPPAPTGLTAIP